MALKKLTNFVQKLISGDLVKPYEISNIHYNRQVNSCHEVHEKIKSEVNRSPITYYYSFNSCTS